MAIEIIGGSELITPTQARVMMFGFAPSSWLLTKTTGVSRSALVGFMLFLGISSSNFKFRFTIFSSLTFDLHRNTGNSQKLEKDIRKKQDVLSD
jgi:hypothetical protein